MKFLNDFKNLFAIVGVVSLIFWTCASDSVSNDSNDDSSLPPQITGGTYQISAFSIGSTLSRLVALNTETGVIKAYYFNANDNNWYESDESTIAGIDGNLTVNH